MLTVAKLTTWSMKVNRMVYEVLGKLGRVNARRQCVQGVAQVHDGKASQSAAPEASYLRHEPLRLRRVDAACDCFVERAEHSVESLKHHLTGLR